MNNGLKMTLLNNKVREGQNERGRDNNQGMRYDQGNETGMRYDRRNEGGMRYEEGGRGRNEGTMHYPMPRPWPPYGEETEMRRYDGYEDGRKSAYGGYDMDMPPESRRYRDERGRYTSRPNRRRSENEGEMEMRYGGGENGPEMRRIGFQSEPWEEQQRERESRSRSEYGGNIIPIKQSMKGEEEEDEYDPSKDHKKRQRVRAGGTFWMDSPPDAQEMTKEKAREWVGSMKGSDPAKPKGGKWSMEEVKPYAQRKGRPTDGPEFYDFFVIMNAMYSDYYEVAKKYNLQNNPAFFADFADAWLNDEDAVPNKAAMYYECIVKHE